MAGKAKSPGDLGEMKMPFFPMKMNMGGLMPEKIQEMQMRNAEAMMSAARVVFEGIQMISTRNAEMMGSAFEHFTHEAQGLSAAAEPRVRLMKQAELAKSGLQTVLKNMRELTDLTNKCCLEAMDVINTRCVEAMGEAGAQANGGGHTKKSDD